LRVTDKEREKARRTLLRHAEAGRLAVDKALAALKTLAPQDFPPYVVPKLPETGAAVSVAAFAALRGWTPRSGPRLTRGQPSPPS
jgi:hypothetical protein